MPPVAGVSRIGTFHKSQRPFQTERQKRFGWNVNLASACYCLCSRSTGSSSRGPNCCTLAASSDRTNDGPNNSATTYVLGGAPVFANSLPVACVKVLRAGIHNVPPSVYKNRFQVNHHVVIANLANDQFGVRATRKSEVAVAGVDISSQLPTVNSPAIPVANFNRFVGTDSDFGAWSHPIHFRRRSEKLWRHHKNGQA